jgi:hypothetical protein
MEPSGEIATVNHLATRPNNIRVGIVRRIILPGGYRASRRRYNDFVGKHLDRRNLDFVALGLCFYGQCEQRDPRYR